MGWADAIADVGLAVTCGGDAHQLRWSGGRIRAEAHRDLAGEEALVALGAAPAECVTAVQLWRTALADGGFLAEWCEIDLDDPVYRHQLRVAMHRLRTEGVQDLLRGLPPRRAQAMGAFLLRFPQEWVDRAALGVVRASRRLPPQEPGHRAIRRAVQVRARSAFVASLAGWAAVVRPAALVRFDCLVGPWGTTPQVAGILDGTASWCRITLSPQWLLDVWGPGRALDRTGQLVLSAQGDRVVWRLGPQGRHQAAVVDGAAP